MGHSPEPSVTVEHMWQMELGMELVTLRHHGLIWLTTSMYLVMLVKKIQQMLQCR